MTETASYTQNAQGSVKSRLNGINGQDGGRVGEPGDMDLRHLFLMLWRRKVMVAAILLLGLFLAAVIVNLVPPRYSARASFLIEEDKPSQALGEDMKSLTTFFNADSSMILSELEVVRSRSLARLVVERLDLLSDPEFNPNLRQMESAQSLSHEQSFKRLNIYKSELSALPANITETETNLVITNFLEKLRVRSIPGSRVIQVEFSSYDPGKAALIANAIADIYIEQRLEEKFRSSKRLADWLDSRLSTLRKQVRESEAAVQEYKAAHNLSEGTKDIVSAEQVSQINAQLVLAKVQKAEAEARLEQVRNIASKPGGIEAAAEVINSSLIQRLKHDKSRLLVEMSDLSARYGPRHPEMIKRRKELADLNQNIRDEMDKIIDGIENELSVAHARVSSLEKSLSEIEGVQHEENEAMIKLRELVREAESNRLLYDTFLATYKRSDKQEDLQDAQAKVISYAVIPQFPSFPNKILVLSLSALVSLFVGLAVCLLLEKLDNSFRSAGQLESALGFPCFALIPRSNLAKPKDVADYVLSKPSSVIAESVRTLRTVLNLRAQKDAQKPKIITVTSSFPGEGKTTLSTWMARLAAKSGEKVILIDCDLRRPNVHRTIGMQNKVSLVEYLSGKNTLEEVVQRDDPSGLHIIYGRSVTNSALDLISSRRMERLVESLGEAYDLIILDSPACLAVSDARVLSRLSDHTLYVVAWDKTPREVVEGGVKQFRDMNCDSLSFVLTGVDVERHVKYGYGDTVYYYGRYKEYYAD